jgi:hypothetical protein
MQRLAGFVIAATLAASSFGQVLISSKSGMIHHVDGKALLDGKPFHVDKTRSTTIPEGKVLETTQGRAEVLLSPGTFLRLADSSSLKMLSADLGDTSVELVSGAALIEIVMLGKGHQVRVTTGAVETQLVDEGLYAFDADTSLLRVYAGKAMVAHGATSFAVTKGRQISLNSPAEKEKFDVKNTRDGLYNWSERRSMMLASANRNANTRGGLASSYRVNTSQWLWDPYMMVYTFLPSRGYYGSPFGYYYYSYRDYQNALASLYNNRTDNSSGYSASSSNVGSFASSAPSAAAAAASVSVVSPEASRPSTTVTSAPVEASGARSR